MKTFSLSFIMRPMFGACQTSPEGHRVEKRCHWFSQKMSAQAQLADERTEVCEAAERVNMCDAKQRKPSPGCGSTYCQTPLDECCRAPEEDEGNGLSPAEETHFTHLQGGCGFCSYYEMDIINQCLLHRCVNNAQHVVAVAKCPF